MFKTGVQFIEYYKGLLVTSVVYESEVLMCDM